MKRLFLFLLLASAAFGQMSSTGSITTNASNCFTTNVCISMTLFNSPALQTVSTAIQVSGTWTGTLSFEASVDGVTFVALPAGPVAGGATVTSTTANGTWVANIQALNLVRVRSSAAMTGTAVVLLQASANGNSIPFPQFAVASLPTNLPIGTLAVATDSNAGSCTVGGSSALALCRWSGSAWVAMSSGGGGSGTVTNTGGALTLNSVMLGAGGSDSKVTTAFTTDGTSTLTVGVAGGGNGVLALAGTTSGTATITAPAVAGTTTNAVVFSNNIRAANQNNCTNGGSFNAGGTGGISFPAGANVPSTCAGGAEGVRFNGGIQAGTGTVGFGTAVTANDVGVSRGGAAGVLAVGTGGAASVAGVVASSAVRGAGTAATLTGTGACATFGAQTGGAWAGQSSCASATAASTLTITPGTTAPNGWVCYVQDETTRANLFQQTSHTATACTLTITSVTQNDVFVFTAIQY